MFMSELPEKDIANVRGSVKVVYYKLSRLVSEISQKDIKVIGQKLEN